MLERASLGLNDADARQRIEANVRAEFDTMARALRLMASGMADPASVVEAQGGNPTAARRLFSAADAALNENDEAEFAVTAYAADGRPLAWAGRPSELPEDRLQGDEAWFFRPRGPRSAARLRRTGCGQHAPGWHHHRRAFPGAAAVQPRRGRGYVPVRQPHRARFH
jgi:hypothetical protein